MHKCVNDFLAFQFVCIRALHSVQLNKLTLGTLIASAVRYGGGGSGVRLIFTQLHKDVFVHRMGFNKADDFYNCLESLAESKIAS